MILNLSGRFGTTCGNLEARFPKHCGYKSLIPLISRSLPFKGAHAVGGSCPVLTGPAAAAGVKWRRFPPQIYQTGPRDDSSENGISGRPRHKPAALQGRMSRVTALSHSGTRLLLTARIQVAETRNLNLNHRNSAAT